MADLLDICLRSKGCCGPVCRFRNCEIEDRSRDTAGRIDKVELLRFSIGEGRPLTMVE